MAVDVLAMIDQATERANTPRASRKPVFLFLKEGEKALIRPLVNITNAIVLNKHNKWSDNRDFRVNAVCASEIDRACQHCEDAVEAEDKKLKASPVIFLPIFVHSVIDVRSGQEVTYTEKDENDRETVKPVKGFRVLELTLYGTAFSILQVFRSYIRDEDEHTITSCDFSIEQVGAGQKKNFVVTPKAPKPINPGITAKLPPLGTFRAAILGAIPPLVTIESGDPEIDGFVQAVKNARGVTPEVAADDIPVF